MTKINEKNVPEKLIEDTSVPYRNKQAKRRFFEHLSGGEGFAGDSVSTFAEAVGQWQQFSKNDDFINFDKSKAIEFVAWQKVRPTKTKSGSLSPQTQYNYLRRIKKFFVWLAEQKEYKKVRKTDVDFLRLSKKEARIATSGTTRPMPTFEEVKKIITSIHPKNEIDERDRAILSLALITGMRISAIATLKMKNFNRADKLFDQNPGGRHGIPRHLSKYGTRIHAAVHGRIHEPSYQFRKDPGNCFVCALIPLRPSDGHLARLFWNDG